VGAVSFDRIADRYDETRGGLDRGRWLAREIGAHLQPGSVLEIGIGTGAVALPLTERGRPVVGVDVSVEMLARAHERLGEVVVRADGYHLPIGTSSVDNVLLVWVLQLVPDLAGLLAEARRVLRPGGRVIAAVSARTVPEDEIDAILRPMHEALRPPPDRPELVVPAAAQAGLDLVTSPKVTREGQSSPAEQARQVEQRTFSSTWDVPDDVWQAVAVPAITALRALPDPEQRRTRVSTQQLLVFSAVPSAA